MAFQQILRLDEIPPNGWRGVVEAPANALSDIAERIDAPEVIRLRSEIELHKTARGLSVSGTLDAALVRECVASLEPFEEAINEPFELQFTRSAEPDAHGEAEIDPDAPEPLTGDSIDLADLLIQQLSLAMAPFPRKPGAASLAEKFAPPQSISPFEALKSKIAEDGEQG